VAFVKREAARKPTLPFREQFKFLWRLGKKA
jgi:hypothetical protein